MTSSKRAGDYARIPQALVGLVQTQELAPLVLMISIVAVPFGDIVLGARPFVVVLLLNLLLIAFFLEIVHWLPNKLQ